MESLDLCYNGGNVGIYEKANPGEIFNRSPENKLWSFHPVTDPGTGMDRSFLSSSETGGAC